MAYDNVSTELSVLTEFPGAKVKGIESNGKSRKHRFTDVSVVAAELSQLTIKLPADAYVSGIYITAVSGTGTFDVGLSGGTATDILSAADPAAGDILAGKLVEAGSSEVYVKGAGTVVISGWVEYVASA